MASSLLSVLATLFIAVISSHLVTADCSHQLIFTPRFQPLECGGDGGGSELRITDTSISFRAFGNRGELVHGSFPTILPDRLQLNIAQRSNGSINLKKSSVTIDGRRVTFGKDPKTFEEYFQVMQIIVLQYELGQCPIDHKNQKFPELAYLRGSLATLASMFGVIDCTAFLQGHLPL